MFNLSNKYLHLFTYLFLSYFFLTVTPFGDEPDFGIRSSQIQSLSTFVFDEFQYSDQTTGYIPSDYCDLQSIKNYNYIWYEIDKDACQYTLIQSLKKLLFKIILLLPIFTLFLFGQKISNKSDLKNDINIIFISLFSTGLLYYTSLISHEVYTLVLSLAFLLFRKKLYVNFLILLLIAMIDYGNSLVIFAFYSFYFYLRLLKYFIKNFILIGILSLTFLIYLSSNFLLEFIPDLTLFELYKFLPVGLKKYFFHLDLHHLMNAETFGKYPIIFRPIIVFLTGIYFTPKFVTSILVIMIHSLSILIIFYNFIIKKYRININNSEEIDSWIYFIAVIMTILFFTTSFPAYCNAKYYIFTVPFIIKTLSFYINTNKIFKFFLFNSLLLIFNLSLYTSI